MDLQQILGTVAVRKLPFPINYKSHVTSRVPNHLMCGKFTHLKSKPRGRWGEIFWNSEQEWSMTHTHIHKAQRQNQNIKEVLKWASTWKHSWTESDIKEQNSFMNSFPIIHHHLSQDTGLCSFKRSPHLVSTVHPPWHSPLWHLQVISCKPHLQRAHPSHSSISWYSETGFAHVFNTCQCDDFSLTNFPRQQN